jgi:hypothetical protein
MPKRTSDPTYLRNRASILAGSPLCHWCGNNPATEADHLIEHDRGGTDDLDNLVPSCRPCNARRGQAYLTRRNQLTRLRREQAVTQNGTEIGFFHDPSRPRAPAGRISFRKGEGDQVSTSSSDQNELALTGREQPRLESAWVGGDSFGGQVAGWAATHLMPLMPWQVHAVTGMLEHDGGRLLRREALVSTARQQGKSVLLTSMIGWWVTEHAARLGRPQHVLSTANQLDRAEAIFSALAPVLVERFGGKQLQAIGRKKVTMPDGSTWEIRAASARLHGGSYDLIVVDELWNIAPSVMDDALRPSMIARPNPLLACFSTAGDMSSHSMINMREQALADIDAGNQTDTYFAEWSMPMGADPKDERWWGWANPALGTTVTIEALRAASKKESFLRAHLNQWITTRGAMLDPGVWDSCATTRAMPGGGVLAIDSSVDEARYVGTRATMCDGRVMVDVEFVVDSEDAMWAEVERVMMDKTVNLAVTPTLELHLPPEYARRCGLVGYGELLKFTSLVRSMIQEGRVIHTNARTLSEHMNRAVGVKTAQGYVLSSQKSPGPIEVARTAVWAIALVSRPQTKQKPMLVVS